MTNKYAEGYPGKRYYGGCQHVDTVEDLAIQRCKQIFGAEHVNVQPHSGSQANMAAYLSVLKTGDSILGMDLAQGGHLTHGSKVNFSGILFRVFSYGVDRETETINYDAVQKVAEECRPRMLIVGASAYARTFDFPRFQLIAKSVGAYLLVDIAHISGLIARGFIRRLLLCRLCHHDPHKTLRGPRGGGRECKAEYAKAVDKTYLPRNTRRTLNACDRGEAVAFKEALSRGFCALPTGSSPMRRCWPKGSSTVGTRLCAGGHRYALDADDI